MVIAEATGVEVTGIISGILIGAAGLALSIRTYFDQRDTKAKADRALAASEQHARHARLDFELRREAGSSVMLLAHNLGPHDARNVEIAGRLDHGGFNRFAVFPSIAAGTYQARIVPQPGYYIIAGNSHFELLVGWDDGAGRHDDVSFVATRRVPDDPVNG